MRPRLAAVVAAGAIALAGCGGDDEEKKSGADAGTTTEQTETTATATTEAKPPVTETEPAEPDPTGEDQPGGAGDEVENTIPAEISGRGGKLSPRRVSVAPFIRLAVTLSSADGQVYELRGGGGTLQVGGPAGEDASTVIVDGLRPGKSLVLTGPQGSVRITANAEPGP